MKLYSKPLFKFAIASFILFYAAHLIYWKNYWKPELFIWDENYHIASAARYLNSVFFMEPHPPLGKLILALGEKIVNINNGITYGYEKFDIIPHFIQNQLFSFAGYRFFPTLFSIFNVMLFASCVFALTRSYLLFCALSCLPLLDNALILHGRGAMLDSFLIFGHLLSILAYVLIIRSKNLSNLSLSLLIGVMNFGLFFASMTKVFGLALLILWPIIFYQLKDRRKFILKNYFVYAVATLLLSLSVWTLHVQLGKKIETGLHNNGTYYASSKYERLLLGLEKDSLLNLPMKIYENIRYIWFYNKNTLPLDMEEKLITGSYPLTWPVGSRPIMYRWHRAGDQHSYMYLIPNIWGWLFGLLSLIILLVLLSRHGLNFFREHKILLGLFTLYLAYFLPMNFIWRVLYLYHYFPLLIISWLIGAYILNQFFEKTVTHQKLAFQTTIILFPFLLFHGFYFYKDFVYFRPKPCEVLKSKNIFPFWGMKFPTCIQQDKENLLLNHLKNGAP